MPNKNKTFEEIHKMIVNSCKNIYYNGSKGLQDVILKCATEIYIAQMKEGSNNGNL